MSEAVIDVPAQHAAGVKVSTANAVVVRDVGANRVALLRARAQAGSAVSSAPPPGPDW